jgi:RimJ/RimL family protein N-acetyltransferase
VLKGDLVFLAPVTEAHIPELRRILRTPEVHARWGDADAEPGWPLEDPTVVCFAVLVDDEVRGMIQYGEEDDPEYRHASVDVFLDPVVHGRGVGQDTVRTLARYLIEEKGHHRLVIDPSADNAAAIRCYAKVGFKPVGIMREYERDNDGTGWHDGLLMDLLAAELT